MTELMSWGRYPSQPQTAHPCYWPDDITAIFKQQTSLLPYGNGLSYGDSCLAASNHVLHTRFLDRFIAVDWQNGIITAEPGVTLEEVLALSIPNGWFLPVTPGTKYVTLGGALANDVHGKNHHLRGTFGRYVNKFGLIRSDGSSRLCSPTENTDFFAATIGGLGLTGIISWVELKLIPITSNQINTTTIRFESLDEFFNLSAELDPQHEYTVAWIDCLAKTGRGIFTVGDHALEDGDLIPHTKSTLSLPFTPPISLVNKFTLKLFNTAYYYMHRAGRINKAINYNNFFYPLDSISNWNRLYGPKGFQQYQCVIPNSTAKDAIQELLNTISASGNGSFLAVLKRCGNITSPGLLSFPLPGVSLALDFPQNNNLTNILFPKLDAIVRQASGRLYPAKDAHMSGEDFRYAYPNWEKIDALRDPALCSLFWKRVIS